MNVKKLIGTILGVAMFAALIAGATFAYFSASDANNNAINVGSTEVTLDLEGEKSNFYTDLIPVDADNTNFKLYPGLTARNVSQGTIGKGTCTDDRGNAICGVYEFTITNTNTTVAQTVYGSLKIEKNEFSNLSYAVFKGAAASLANNFDVNSTKVGSVTASDTVLVVARKKLGTTGSTEAWSNVTQLLQPKGTTGSSQTYTIVVWLEEAGSANNTEQNKKFTASIKCDTGSGNGVTGTLTGASG